MLLAACYPPATPVPPVGESADTSLTLVGPIWSLTTLNGEPIQPDTIITAQFGPDGLLGGISGCNQYNARYEVDGTNLTIAPGASTRKACPEAVMEQERAYLAALGATRSYEISGETLSLKDEAGNAVAVFEAVSQDLVGTAWSVLSYNNGKEAVVGVMAETELTATFGEDGQVTGSGGCNDYFGPYETDGNAISMGPFGLTRMLCPEQVMEQEGQYLAALESATVYKIEGDSMEMRTSEGALAATFRRTSAPTEAEEAAGEACVNGAITFSGDQALPEDAVAQVQVNDTSLADAPAVTLGEQVISNPGSFPIPYEVCYDPAEIQGGHTYTMQARIEDSAGNLLYINDTAIHVITNGNPSDDVEIPVIKVGG